MKRAIPALMIVCGSAAIARADVSSDLQKSQGYGMGGCGLGSMVFESNTKGSQILAVTTNGTFGSQTFGISSGTSNCTTGGVVKAEREQQAFVEVNLASIERDAASGGGEYLAALGTLMGCETGVQPELFQVTQQGYERIFPSAKASATQVLQAMKSEARRSPALVKSCARL
ncbi:MAG: DUF3015 family protein [Gemmatimonadales bacterium]